MHCLLSLVLLEESKIKFPPHFYERCNSWESERNFNITSFYSSYNPIVFIHVPVHCRHCKWNPLLPALRDVVEAPSGSLWQTVTQPNFQSTPAFVRDFPKKREEVVPSLWAVLVIQGASELPIAQLHGRDETKSLTLSGLLSHGSHTGKVYLYIFFYRVIY